MIYFNNLFIKLVFSDLLQYLSTLDSAVFAESNLSNQQLSNEYNCQSPTNVQSTSATNIVRLYSASV